MMKKLIFLVMFLISITSVSLAMPVCDYDIDLRMVWANGTVQDLAKNGNGTYAISIDNVSSNITIYSCIGVVSKDTYDNCQNSLSWCLLNRTMPNINLNSSCPESPECPDNNISCPQCPSCPNCTCDVQCRTSGVFSNEWLQDNLLLIIILILIVISIIIIVNKRGYLPSRVNPIKPIQPTVSRKDVQANTELPPAYQKIKDRKPKEGPDFDFTGGE